MDSLEDDLWRDHRTVLVIGNVTRAAWWPPSGETPGVLVAPGLDQAREALRSLIR